MISFIIVFSSVSFIALFIGVGSVIKSNSLKTIDPLKSIVEKISENFDLNFNNLIINPKYSLQGEIGNSKINIDFLDYNGISLYGIEIKFYFNLSVESEMFIEKKLFIKNDKNKKRINSKKIYTEDNFFDSIFNSTSLRYNIENKSLLNAYNNIGSQFLKNIYDDNVKSFNYPIDIFALLSYNIRKKLIDISEFVEKIEIKNIDAFFKIKLKENDSRLISDFTGMTLTDKINHHYAKISELLNIILLIIKEITLPFNLPDRLIDNLKTEKNVFVKTEILKILSVNFKKSYEISLIMKKFISDDNPSIAITASKYLGDKGLNLLLKLFDNKKTTSDQKIEIIKYFTKLKFKQSYKILLEQFANTKKYELKKEILIAFKEFKSVRMNNFLIECLNKEKIILKPYIIDALKTCGKLSAVEHLYNFKKGKINFKLINLINEAIASIQSKHAKGEKGFLSVQEISETDGALSNPDDLKEGGLTVEK